MRADKSENSRMSGSNNAHPKTTKKTKKPSIKQQIRGVERLLKRDPPPDIRKQHEAKLAALNQSVQNSAIKEKEQKLSKKYHMVKFFERQKLTRQISQCERRLADTSDKLERNSIEKKLADLKGDLDYVLHFPRDRKYVSVLKTEERARIDEIKAVIAQRKQQDAERRREERLREAAGSEGEEEEGGAGLDAEDDFFEAASDHDHDRDHDRDHDDGEEMMEPRHKSPKKSSADSLEDVQRDEVTPKKKKRDKRLPDRNRKAKKLKTE